jgi:DNA modification methylase
VKVETALVESLKLDPKNARTHNGRNLDAIKRSLERFGLQKPIVVDGDGVVVAGNGTLEAARALGWTEIQVHRTPLKGAEAKAYALADNQTAILAEWDDHLLAEALADLKTQNVDVLATGFTEQEVERLIREELGGAGPEEGEIPEPPEKPISQPGDMWILGEHRLLCGDSTKAEDLARLMAGEKAALLSTDPPYCVQYTGDNRPIHDGKRSGKDWSHVYREVDIKDLGTFLDSVFRAVLPQVIESAAIYVWHAHVQQHVIAQVFERFDLIFHQVLVWVKPTGVFGHSYYQWRHEPCAFGWRRGHKPEHGQAQMNTVWEVDWEGKQRVVGNEHPTQKPLRLFEIPMEQHTKAGDVVLEPFSGSGSQLVAAEKLERRCRAMEISPAFVDVGVRRWEAMTGKKALLEGTEKSFDQVAAERSAS